MKRLSPVILPGRNGAWNALADKKSTSPGMRNVYALGVVSFFTDISSEMVFSVLPSFMVEVLGVSKTQLGLVEGVAEASSNILRMVSGYISDWMGRRKLLVLMGYGVSTVVKPLFALASNWIDVLLVRVTDRVGKAIRTTPRDSLLSASVPGGTLGKAFGLHRTLDQAGAVLGPLLATLLLPLLSYEGLFYVSLVPASVALLVLLFFVQEVAAAKAGGTLLGNIREAAGADFLRFLSVVALFSIGAYDYSFILVSAGQAGVPNQYVPLVYMLINVLTIVVAIPIGVASDRVGRERMLAVGYGFLGITDLILFLPFGGIVRPLIASCSFGLYLGAVETIQRAVIPKYAEARLRGTAYGLYYLTVGVFYLVANVAVGFLWDNMGASTAFAYSLATSASASLLMLALVGTRKK